MKPYAYISGSLTNLSEEMKAQRRAFYEMIAAIAECVGFDSYCPHKYSDPTLHANLTEQEVDLFDRTAVMRCALVIAEVGITATGVGQEIEMANRANLSLFLLAPKDEVVSRLPLGNPALKAVVRYADVPDLQRQLRAALQAYIQEILDTKLPLFLKQRLVPVPA